MQAQRCGAGCPCRARGLLRSQGNAPAAALPAEGAGGAFTRSRPRKDEKAPAGRAAACRPHSLVRLFIVRDGKNIGGWAIRSRISEGGSDMKTHYTATKIIARSPENVKYSLGGIKEGARAGFKAEGWGGGGLGSVWPRPRQPSVHFPHCCWLSFGKKSNRLTLLCLIYRNQPIPCSLQDKVLAQEALYVLIPASASAGSPSLPPCAFAPTMVVGRQTFASLGLVSCFLLPSSLLLAGSSSSFKALVQMLPPLQGFFSHSLTHSFSR